MNRIASFPVSAEPIAFPIAVAGGPSSRPQRAIDLNRAANSLPRSSHFTNASIGAANNSDLLESIPPRSIAETLLRLEEADAGLRIDRVHPGSIRVKDDGLWADNQRFGLDGDGFVRLCDCVNAPSHYLAGLPSSIGTSAVQFHIEQRDYCPPRHRDGQTAIISRGGRFLSMGRSDLLNLTGSEVVTAALEGVGERYADLKVSDLRFNDESFTLEFISSREATEVRVGDGICAGLQVQHSRLGDLPTVILSFVYRLICRNGMVHRECTGARHTSRIRRLVGGTDAATEQLRTQIRRLSSERWTHAQRLLEPICRSSQEPIANPLGVMERFLRSGRLFSANLLQWLQEAWALEGSEPTAFGVLNALTRVATHEMRLSQRQRRALAALAGIYARQSTHICPHCFSVLNTNA